MKFLLPLIILLNFNIVAQDCIDKTKDVKNILSSKKVTSYNVKVIGGCIKDDILHVTLTVDGQYTLALRGMGFNARQAGYAQTLQPYFESVELFYKKFPEITNFIMYYVDFEKVTDSFGNFVENKKIIRMTLGMTRETATKVNWKYVDENLKSAILYKENELNKIIGMLDIMKLNSNE